MEIIMIPKEIQEIVEEYISTHAKMKELEKKVKQMKGVIEPFMKENSLEEIQGVTQLGKIQIAEQDRAQVTSKFTYYDSAQIAPRIPAELKRQCMVHLIDKDAFEALAQLKLVPENFLSYRLTNRVSLLRVMHTI